MRISSSMISGQYLSNLNRESNLLSRAATTAYDFRAFHKPSEDPFLAAQTFQIRRQLALNETYTSNIANVKGAVSSAESTLRIVSNLLSNAGDTNLLAGITATSSQSDRDAVANTLLTMREAVVSDMNAQYGNRYLFSGAGGYGTAPFSIDGNGDLLYRGVNVDTGVNTNGASVAVNYGEGRSMQIDFGKGIAGRLNGYQFKIDADAGASSNTVAVDTAGKTITLRLKSGTTKQQLQDLLNNKAGKLYNALQAVDDANLKSITDADLKQIAVAGIDEPGIASETVQSSTEPYAEITDQADLDALAKETSYVDIGLGMRSENGKVVEQSAYNAAMPGIAFLGYGMETAGGAEVPKNVYSLLGDMAGILKNKALKGQDLMDAIDPYLDSFSESKDKLSSSLAEVGTDLNFLDSTDEHITNVNLSLNSRDEAVEFVDAADAITNYSMQKFAYMAALQVGTSLLQPTLLDFMK